MKPDIEYFNPEAQQSFEQSIPQLLHTAVESRKPKHVRNAEQQLSDGLSRSPYYDPLLDLVSIVQGTYLGSGNPEKIKAGAGLLDRLVARLTQAVQEEGSRPLQINVHTIKIAGTIVRLDESFQNKDFVQRNLTTNYKQVAHTLAPKVLEYSLSGLKEIEVLPNIGDLPPLEQQLRREAFNKWGLEINETANDRAIVRDNRPKTDRILSLIKNEPVTNRPSIYSRIYGGTSLKTIEKSAPDIKTDSQDIITKFVLASVTSNSAHQSGLIGALFLGDPAIVFSNGKELFLENPDFVKKIAEWQTGFIYNLIYSEDPKKLEESQKILAQLDPITFQQFLSVVTLAHVIAPHEYSQESKGDLLKAISHNPLARKAVEYKHDWSEEYIYYDKVAQLYFVEEVIPRLRSRLEQFGLSEQSSEGLERTQKALREIPFEQSQLEELERIFATNCGENFLQNLEKETADISMITDSVWEALISRGIDYLPIEKGADIVEFSDGSAPEMMGITSISFTRVGIPEDWRSLIKYTFKGSHATLIASLSPDGRFTVSAPIEDKMPSIYQMLRHITTLTFHDLTIIQEGESAQRAQPVMKPDTNYPVQSNESTQVEVTNVVPETKITKKRYQPLPRKRSDESVIKGASKKGGYTPRRVGLYRADLRGAKTYRAAHELYTESVLSGNSEGDIAYMRTELETARTGLYKISSGKKNKFPPSMMREVVIDPVTGEELDLKNWVTDHTSPVPTEEERASLPLMFERHFKVGRERQGSAMAFLDQYKELFLS